MNTKKYSIENPPEVVMSGITQMSVGVRDSAPRDVDPSASWRMDGMLAELGPVVAYERTDGSMALSTWDGETKTVWATFDVSPPPALMYMRKHMTEAYDLSTPRPEGAIKVICFARGAGTRS